MATTTKSQKDKPQPRLAPRPTAASAARAARNATNRNLILPLTQRAPQPIHRQSPTRVGVQPSLPLAFKPRSLAGQQRFGSKTNLKTDVKINRNLENAESHFDIIPPMTQQSESYITGVALAATMEQRSETHLTFVNSTDHEVDPATDDSCERMQGEQNFLGYELEAVCPLIEIPPKSLPQSPANRSRPQTPKNHQSSRPLTPRSRPTTPAQSLHRNPPTSRPNTPQHVAPACRPKTPTTQPTPPRVPTPNSAAIQPRPSVNDTNEIKSVYTAKQRQFHRMKKELDLKQQAILEVLDSMRNLSESITQEGGSGAGEGLQLQELVVFNVADWTTEEVTQLCREAVASSTTDGAIEYVNTTKPIDECAIAELDANVSKVPSRFADLCLQAFTARQELIDWVKELIGDTEDGRGQWLDRIARYNAQGLELCETLREVKSCADDAVGTVTQLSRRACQERGTLILVGESLVREIARLRQDLEARTIIVNEMREVRVENETAKPLEETRRELDEERNARATVKDKLATAESQLRQARIRITKMDRQLREAEASITNLTGTVKSLEDQSRQREVQLEARARKLKESLKTSEIASNQIAQQRDALQTEVQSLKEKIETVTAQHKSAINDLNKEVKELKGALEEQRQQTQKEAEMKSLFEAELLESRNANEELKAKNTDLENSRPNPELPTEREMDMWAELQATKDTLHMTEDEVGACKREKFRFLETLTKIAETDNKVGMQQKLASELLSKEEIVGKMQTQIRELTKNIKLNEHKVIQYEQYVRQLQAHNRAVVNCQEAPNGISYQDLQQEIMTLRMSLLEAVHRNEEMSEMMVQKEQQLDQQDKTSRAQARVIKVREELINMLKNKETEQSRELGAMQQDLEHRMKIVDEVNKQISAKADEIQELFSTLENKQQQIHRLEKIVLALEEQQRRAQAQRTRHEEKIAALEHELAAGNRRERKFIFF